MKLEWSVSDVDKHKKGLSSDQKKKWVSVANGVYKDCMSKGGSDKTCAPKAIRIANSKFSEGGDMYLEKKTEVKRFKSGTFQLVDPEALVTFKESEIGKGNVDIIAYSGKDINHFWWGKLAIDLQGMELSKKTYPVLDQHDLTRKIGFTGKPIVTDDFKLVHNNVTFVDTPFSEEFQKLSKQGFPYEASITAKPSVIEEVEEGTSVDVNGRKFSGPGSIFRKWEYREVSVCVFGADKNTKAKAFDEGDEFDVEVFKYARSDSSDSNNKQQEEVNSMFDLEKMKTENPEEYQKFVATIKEEAKKEVESQFTEIITSLKAEIDSLKETNLKFQKNEDIRKEKEAKLAAEIVWAKALSVVPERLHSKVKNQVSYEKFMKEGVLDETSFSEAVANEIKD